MRTTLRTLAIGATGSVVAIFLSFPLAPLLGAVFATTAARQVGLDLSVDHRLRRIMHIILGVCLGARMPPDTLERISDWGFSLAAIPIFIVAGLALGALYLRRIAGYDPMTSAFGAMPGGLLVMMTMGEQSGGRGDTILFTHALRVMLAVTVIPFVLIGIGAPTGGFSAEQISFVDLTIALAAGATGSFAARLVRFPASDVMGSMLTASALYMSGAVSGAPPFLLFAAALMVSGAGLGSTMERLKGRETFVMVGHTAVLFVLLCAMALLTAEVVHLAADVPLVTAFLAFAPGGLVEMSAVALAMDLDASYVAVHHAIRVLLCSIFGMAIAAWLRQRG